MTATVDFRERVDSEMKKVYFRDPISVLFLLGRVT